MPQLHICSRSYAILLQNDESFNESMTLITGVIDDDTAPIDGFVDYVKQIFHIRSSCHKDVIATCILNLSLEVLANNSGIDSLAGVPLNSLTQVIIALFSPHLLMFLRDNEHLLQHYGILGTNGNNAKF